MAKSSFFSFPRSWIFDFREFGFLSILLTESSTNHFHPAIADLYLNFHILIPGAIFHFFWAKVRQSVFLILNLGRLCSCSFVGFDNSQHHFHAQFKRKLFHICQLRHFLPKIPNNFHYPWSSLSKYQTSYNSPKHSFPLARQSTFKTN